MIPLIKEEAVNRHQWLTDADFIDALAIGNSLPGPIATKIRSLGSFRCSGILIQTFSVMIWSTILATS